MPRKATPQEKKRQSYEKDRRSEKGGGIGLSRKGVRDDKVAARRANRRAEHLALEGVAGPADEEVADAAQTRLARKAPKRVEKPADVPLGEAVRRKLERRSRVGMNKPAGDDID